MKIFKYFKIIIINIIIFFSLFIIIDLIFGSWFKNNFSYKLSSERNIYRVYKFNFSNYSGQSIYERDSNGFRINNQSQLPENIDIIFTGGSTTNQKFLNYKDTIVNGLDDYFEDLTFVNAGVDGLSIKGHINSFEFWFNKINKLNPKFYIFYIGLNDRFLLKNKPRSIDEFQEASSFENVREYLESNSFFYKQFRHLKVYLYLKNNFQQGANIVNEKGVVYGERSTKKFAKYTEFVDKKVFDKKYSEYYLSLLNTLSNLVRENNAEPIFITQISGHGMTKELFTAAETIISHCKNLNLKCINLAENIDLNYDDFYDQLHLNPKGSKKVTNFLSKELEKIFN